MSLNKFFLKIYDLRDRFKGVIQQMDELKELRDRFHTLINPPFVPAPARMVYSPGKGRLVYRQRLDGIDDTSPYVSMADIVEGVYLWLTY